MPRIFATIALADDLPAFSASHHGMVRRPRTILTRAFDCFLLVDFSELL
jgi:hypothetical protein